MVKRLTLGGLIVLSSLSLGITGCGERRFNPPRSLSIEVQIAEARSISVPPAIFGAALSNPGLLIPRNNDDSDADGNADDLDSVVNGPEDAKQLTVVTVKTIAP